MYIFSAKIHISSLFSIPCSISLWSLEIRDIPSNPLSLLIILSISLIDKSACFIIYGIIEASISPQRVPIITPALGVNPIEVSTHFKESTAVILAPLPIWQTITLASFLFKISLNLIATNLWLVPCAPYLLTLYFVYHS